jgi:hypothetical protein
MQYRGQTGANADGLLTDRLNDCMVCSRNNLEIKAQKGQKLVDFIELLKKRLMLNNPSIESSDKGMLYFPKPASLERVHHFKLELTFKELIE